MSKMLWSRIAKNIPALKNVNNVQCTMTVQKCTKLLIHWPDSPLWWACVYPVKPCDDCIFLRLLARRQTRPSPCCPRPCAFPRPRRSTAAPPLPACGSRCPHCCLHGWRKARRISHDQDVTHEGEEERKDLGLKLTFYYFTTLLCNSCILLLFIDVFVWICAWLCTLFVWGRVL